MSREQNAGRSRGIKIGNNSFERVEEFKYLLPNDIYIYIYISYRTVNLQKFHFIYLFNK